MSLSASCQVEKLLILETSRIYSYLQKKCFRRFWAIKNTYRTVLRLLFNTATTDVGCPYIPNVVRVDGRSSGCCGVWVLETPGYPIGFHYLVLLLMVDLINFPKSLSFFLLSE